MFAERSATVGDHLAAEPPDEHAVFLRNVFPDGEAGALFAADEDTVLLEKLANLLEAHRGLVELDLVFFGKRVDEIGGGNGLADSIFPAAGFDQVVKEQRNNVVGLEERTVLVGNPKTIGIAIGRDANCRADFAHLFTQVFEQVIVGFGGVCEAVKLMAPSALDRITA